MFRKVAQNRIYHDLVGQIQDAILDGKLKSGDKLPSQRELVKKFQTSRASLREALCVLEHKGLIKVKLGVSGGAVVKDINTEQITEDLSLLMQHQKVSFDQLSEFREGVEGCVAALAAKRARKKDINWLKKLLAKAQKYIEAWDSEWEDFLQVDLEIHIALAEISGNPVYLAVIRMVHENILEKLFFKDEQSLKENYRALCDIVDAIEHGDADRARSLVQDHIVQCTQWMKNAHPDIKTS